MADIFISYARPDRDAAKRLAERLAARGYQVWWDAELVGSDDFRDVIFEELTLAKAVIVIWSEHSVRSKFVRDEASRADRAEKLVSTCMPGFDMQTLPLGFGGHHCHPVEEIEQTAKALARLGVVPANEKPAVELALIQSEAQAWERIKASNDRRDFEAYIKTYANGLYRAAAKISLRKLDFLDNKAVRGAGLFGYRALQAYAWLLVFCVIFGVLAAPFTAASGSGQPASVGGLFLVLLIAGYATYRLYRWFYSRPSRG
jgi:hypothetical protein